MAHSNHFLKALTAIVMLAIAPIIDGNFLKAFCANSKPSQTEGIFETEIPQRILRIREEFSRGSSIVSTDVSAEAMANTQNLIKREFFVSQWNNWNNYWSNWSNWGNYR
ncbi:MAG: hypothetical protein ACFB8W_19700 [Elainellaceae cyanobacterium]